LVETGATGRAEFEALPPGPVWILVNKVGWGRRALSVTVTEEQPSLQVVMEPAHTLRVTVRDEDGAAVPQATVLVRGRDSLPFGDLTDASGQVTLPHLTQPPWDVSVTARGFESASRAQLSGDVQFTLKRLGGFDVEVLDPSGEPAANATVWIVGPSLWPARSVVTDEEGKASLSGLLRGPYNFRAVSGTLVSQTVVGIPLEESERKPVTIRLEPGRYVRVLVVGGDEEDAPPVEDAELVLTEYGVSPFPLEGKTGPKGEATIGPIPSGPATLSAHATGYVARTAVPVPDEAEPLVRVALRRGGTISGKVVDELGRGIDGARIEVIGIDLDGLPVAETPYSHAIRRGHFEFALGAPAPLVPAGELGVMQGPIPSVVHVTGAVEGFSLGEVDDAWVSGFDGSFKAYPVPPGRVNVLVRHPQYLDAVSETIRLAAGASHEIEIVMTSGKPLRGRVVDDAGLPLGDIRVEVVGQAGLFSRSLFTRPDGTFDFGALPEEVVISVARPDSPTETALRQTVLLSELGDDELELVLLPEREPVSLTITSKDGEPVELAQITVLSLDVEVPLRKTLFSDAAGTVSFDDAVGLHARVRIEAPGFVPSETVYPALPEELAIELLPGIDVEGEITAVRGRQLVEGAIVSLTVQGRRQQVQSDETGKYSFENLPEGEHTLEVEHPDYATKKVDVEVKSEGRDRVFEVPPIDLVEAGSVSGRVVDGSGQPVAAARVGVGFVPAFLPQGRLPVGLVLSDPLGKFELARLEPGQTHLEAYAPGIGRGRLDVVVVEGENTDEVEIVLDQAAAGGGVAGGGVAVTLGETPIEGNVYVSVVHVAAASEAERAGLLAGDTVLSVDGRPVATLEQARAWLTGTAGSDVLVEVWRSGQRQSFRVRREALMR
jgi:protocatechuate 3,4-dioxygenase beta subunit